MSRARRPAVSVSGGVPFDFKGDTPSAAEVAFVERFLARGESFEWIVRGSNGVDKGGFVRSTNDLLWHSNGGIEVELKSPELHVYENARRLIPESVKRALRHEVIKDRFFVDLGDVAPSPQLLAALRYYNRDRSRYPIAQLWVAWADEVLKIVLKT